MSSDLIDQSSPIMKVHGCMMVLAWILCASLGVIVSRYCKDLCPNSALVSNPVWLQAHRILQGCCVSLTSIAIILGFIYCQGYSSITASPAYVHPILGMIVFCLAIINPLITLCRCKPEHPHRPIFNWFHFFIGTIAHVLSIPTVMLGMRMPAAGAQLPFLNYPQWVLIVFVIWQFAVELTLEIHGCVYYQKNKEKMTDYQNDLKKRRVFTNERIRYPEPSGARFKQAVIGVHAAVASLVSIILLLAIIIN